MWSFEPFCSVPSAAKDAKLHITELLTLADDDVVEQLDTEDFASFADSFGQAGIIQAGCWITRWMIGVLAAGVRDPIFLPGVAVSVDQV